MFNLLGNYRKKQEIKEELARKEQKRIRKNQLAVIRYHKKVEEKRQREEENDIMARLATELVKARAEQTQKHTEKVEKKINYL